MFEFKNHWIALHFVALLTETKVEADKTVNLTVYMQGGLSVVFSQTTAKQFLQAADEWMHRQSMFQAASNLHIPKR
jgi:hypothetical protein